MMLRNKFPWLLPVLLGAPLWMGAEECTTANIGDQKVCEYDGKVYAPGDQFPSEDHCNTCSCTAEGSVACTDKACAPSGTGTCDYNGTVYALGDGFQDIDGCNSCNCTEQGAVCTNRACAPGDGDGDGGDPGNGCEHEGKYYAAGTSFTIGCAGCGCDASGKVVCDDIACVGGCRFGDQTFSEGTTVLCPDGCNTCMCGPSGPDGAEGNWASTLIGCPTLPKVEKCTGPATSEVDKVSPLYRDGNALALKLEYGGGCETHRFRLCTTGALTKSLPGQLTLWVMDDGPADHCEAYKTETKVFDLSSLKTILGSQATGSVVLRVGESSLPYAF
jgi:hypothetical protein